MGIFSRKSREPLPGQAHATQPSFQISNLPLFRTAWRRFRRRPMQYILLVLGVAVGVAMMVSVDLANGSASRAFSLSTDTVAGKTTHRIAGGPAGLDEAIYSHLRTELGFAPAAPVVEGYVLSPDTGDQPMRLVGIDPFAEPPFRSYLGPDQQTAAVGLEAFLSEPNTIFISSDLAGHYGLALGDYISLDHGGHLISMRLVGFLEPADKAGRLALEGLLFTDIATAQEIFGMVGRLSHVDLLVEDESDLETLAVFLPAGARIELAAARANALQQMASAFRLNLTAMSLLALVVGMFLIYNTVTFSVIQRRKLFGILRCLGVTGGQLFILILAEAAVLGLIGALLGLGAGVLLGRGMVGLVSQTINDFYFVVNVRSVAIPTATLIKGLVVGVSAAMGAALIPAWEARRTVPQSSLYRSSLEEKAQQAVRWLLLLFLVLSAAGISLLWLPDVSLIITFVGLFIILIACAFLTPGITAALMNRLTPLGGALMGPIGRMAPRDINRSLSRTSVAIAALMIAVAVIVGVSIMVGSFRQTVAQWLENTLQADIYISPPTLTASRISGTLDDDIVAAAQLTPGIKQIVSAWRQEVQAPDLARPVEVVAVSGDISNGNRSYVWIDGQADDLWTRLSDGEGILISEPLSLGENLGNPPAPITLMTESGPREFPVLAIFYDYSSDQGSILIHQELFTRWWGAAPATSLGLFISPGENADEITKTLQQQFQGRRDVVVQSNLSVRGNALDIFDRTFAITAALQLLAVVVAFIGVLSALMSLQLERSRELGILRATGMTVRQLWQLTLLETGLMGATAGLLAMPVGWLLAWILIYVINRRSFGWTLQMDLEPAYFLQALAVAVAAALLAGIYPALRSGNMVIATAIREE
jgi:putative ABC transport system permease protein